MKIDDHTLRSPDQTALTVRTVRGETAPRARLAIIHGFAEHGQRYQRTLEWFAERGIDGAVVDLRGHGRSGGSRTFIQRFSDYTDDASTFLRWVAEQGPSVPWIALGHSMGGLVLARTLQLPGLQQLPDLRGAVFTSPFFKVKMPLPGWKVTAAKALSRLIPRFRLPADVDTATLSKDTEVQQAYTADPLVTSTATARWYTETVQAQADALAAASSIQLPALVQHGLDDGLVDPDGSRAFADALGGPTSWHTWPGLRHELFNEVEREDVYAHVLNWIETTLQADGAAATPPDTPAAAAEAAPDPSSD